MEKLTFCMQDYHAAAVETASHASFYGIHGDAPDCAVARRICLEEAEKRLSAAGIAWTWIYLLSADTIDTSGTKTPYAATVTIAYNTEKGD